jgi:hypothetical protein
VQSVHGNSPCVVGAVGEHTSRRDGDAAAKKVRTLISKRDRGVISFGKAAQT